MAGAGEVKVSLGLDTATAQAQLKAFFAQIGQAQPGGDPFKTLNEGFKKTEQAAKSTGAATKQSFEQIEAAAKQLGYSWDQATKTFSNSQGTTRSLESVRDRIQAASQAAKESGASFYDVARAFRSMDAEGDAFSQSNAQLVQSLKTTATQLKALPVVGLAKDLGTAGAASATASKSITLIGTASSGASGSVTTLGTAGQATGRLLQNIGTGAAASLGAVGNASKAAVQSVDGLGRAADSAGDQLDTLGRGAGGGLQKVGTDAAAADAKLDALTASARDTGTQLKNLGTGGGGLQKVGTDASAAGKAMGAASGGAKTLQSGLQGVGTAGRGLDLTKTYLGNIGTAASSSAGPTTTLTRALTDAGRTTGPLGAVPPVMKQLAAEALKAAQAVDKVDAELKEGAQQVGNWSGAIEEGFKQVLMGIPQGIGMSIGNMLIAPLQQLAGVVPAAVNEFRNLDEVLRLTLAISGASSDQFDTLMGSVQEVGAAAAGTNAEVAEVAKSLAAAGFNLDQIDAALGPIVQGAEATGTAYDTMGDIVVAALGQFRLAADQSTDVVDTLVKGANSANQSVSDIGEALKYVGPVAAATNQSLQDVNIVLGLLANNGIKASTAGTSFRTILTNLQIAAGGAGEEFTELSRGSGRLAETLKLIGADMLNANGELKSGTELVYSLQDAMRGLSTGEQALVSKVLAGSEGLPALNALISATGEQVEKMADAMDNRAGAAADAQAKAMAGLAGSFKQLEGNISNVLTTIGSLIAVGLKPLVDATVAILSAFNALPGPVKTAVVLFAGLVTSVAALAAAKAALAGVMATTFGASMLKQITAFFVAFQGQSVAATIQAMTASFVAMAGTLSGTLATALTGATAGLKAFTAAFTAQNIAQAAQLAAAQLGALAQIIKTQLLAALASGSAGLKAFAAALNAQNIASAANSLKTTIANLGTAMSGGLGKASSAATAALNGVGQSMSKLPATFKAGAAAAQAAGGGLSGFAAAAKAMAPAATAAGTAAAGVGTASAAAGTAAAAGGAAAASGAAGFGALATAAGGFVAAAAPIAAIAAVVGAGLFAIYKQAQGASEMTKKLEGDTIKLEGALKTGGDSAAQSGEKFTWWYDSMIGALGPLGQIIERSGVFGVTLKLLLGTIQLVADGMGRLFQWFEDNGKIDASRAEHEKLGNALQNVSAKIDGNIRAQQGLSQQSEQWRKLQADNIRLTQASVDSLQSRKAKLDQEITALDAAGKGNERVAMTLKQQRSEIEAQLGPAKQRLANMQEELKKADELAGSNTRVEQSYQALESSRMRAYDAIDATAQQREIQVLAELNAGLITETKARALNAKAASDASKQKLAADEEYLTKLQQLLAEGKISEEQYITKKAEVTSRNKELLKERAENEKALKDAIKDLINERLDAYQNEQNRIAQNVQAINQTLSQLGQVATSGIAAFKSLADASTQYELAGIEKAKQARLKMIDDTYKDGEAKEAARQRAELEFENQKRAVLQEQQTFNEEAQRLSYAAKQAELELWYIEAQLANEIAQVEAAVAIEKAKAAGASEQEIAGLQKVLELTKFQSGIIEKQAQLKGQVLEIENQSAEAQLAAKARADGTNTAFAGSVANVGELRTRMQAFVGEVGQVSEGVAGFRDGLGRVATEDAPAIANAVRNEINGSFDQIDVNRAAERLRQLGVPPEVAQAMAEDMTQALSNGADQGAQAGRVKITEAFGKEGTVPKELIKNQLVEAMTSGGQLSVAAAKEQINKLPDLVSFQQLAKILGDSLGGGTAAGQEALNKLQLDPQVAAELEDLLGSSITRGGQEGGAGLRDAVTAASGDLGDGVETDLADAFKKAETPATNWAEQAGAALKNMLGSSIESTTNMLGGGFSKVANDAFAVLQKGLSSVNLNSLEQGTSKALLDPIGAAVQALSRLVAPQGLSTAGDGLKAAVTDTVKAGLGKEMNTASSATSSAGRAAGGLKSAISGMVSYASRFARDMERAADAAYRASRYRFAGGPVTPGQTYTVNEFGREMFMSNSGRLSEIKAPAFGNWSPPTSGQVIPAHLANQVREARQASATADALRVTANVGSANVRVQQASGESGGLQRALISQLQRIGETPGSQTNNITIESARPVNDASRMLAEMSRLKAHRRY